MYVPSKRHIMAYCTASDSVTAASSMWQWGVVSSNINAYLSFLARGALLAWRSCDINADVDGDDSIFRIHQHKDGAFPTGIELV